MTILLERNIFVQYTQIMIMRPEMEARWYIWTDDHVAQGFAYAEGVVSFGLPDHDGEILLTVDSGDAKPALGENCLWAVAAPFVSNGAALVGTVMDTSRVKVPSDSYEATFAVYPGFEREGTAFTFDVRLHLRPEKSPGFAILKHGGHVLVDHVLRTDTDEGH